MSRHEQAVRDLFLPRSQVYQGPFGRIFRNLPAHIPPPLLVDDEADGAGEAPVDSDQRRQAALEKLAGTMFSRFSDFNYRTPAGYTYFGQFVTHDITYDPTSNLQRRNDPDKLRNFRTPRFDLDSLYGGGPADSPFMYDQQADLEGVLLTGRGRTKDNVPTQAVDLPRNEQGQALIGDPRNDENLIVSQIHLAFIKFHNKIMSELAAGGSKGSIFEEAQRLVRWHYQYVVVNDFLDRLAGQETLERVFPRKNGIPEPILNFYNFKSQPFIPVEFSVAAFRVGHAMIRGGYRLNNTTQGHIFVGGELPNDDPFKDFRGGRFLPENGQIRWGFFLDIDGTRALQSSQKFDTKLAPELQDLPSIRDQLTSLAALDLIRSWRMGLPSGQDIAKAMHLTPLSPDEITAVESEENIEFLVRHDFHKSTPFWYYILREAELYGDDGAYLGPVGGTLMAEVLVGLLAGDPLSYLNIYPAWTPAKEEALDTIKAVAQKEKEADKEGGLIVVKRDFQLRDIIVYATGAED